MASELLQYISTKKKKMLYSMIYNLMIWKTVDVMTA